MKLSKTEYIVFVAAGIIVCSFSVLFYFDFSGRTAAGEERIVGSVTYKKSQAQRKYSSQVVWEDIEQRAPVYNNDSIRTAELSEAIIRLNDGTEIAINENSMIVLSFATNEIDIQFRGGSISARRGELEGGSVANMNITSGKTTVSVARSDVQVSGEKERALHLTVNKGTAKVTRGSEERIVSGNQKVTVADDSKELKVYALPLVPLAPLPDSVFVTPARTADVTFAWEKLKQGREGVCELSDSDAFRRIIARKKMDGSTATFNLPPGSYCWRLRAAARRGETPDVSEVRKFIIERVEPPYLIFPGAGQIFHFAQAAPAINFKWSGAAIAQAYRLEIASNSAMNNMVAAVKTEERSIAVDSLAEGTYYWRVVSVIRVSGKTYHVPSETRKILVARSSVVEPPLPQFPPDGESINGRIMNNPGINFSWRRNEEVPAVRITISRQSDFRSLVYSGVSSASFLRIRRKLEPGRYYWRLAGILPRDRHTEPSGVMTFIITSGDTIRLLSPGDRADVTRGSGPLNFTWEKAGVYGEYILQVSTDQSFSRVEKEERTSDARVSVRAVRPGTHFWRVLLRSDDGAVIMTSKPSMFTVLDTLAEPSIISPVNRTTVDMEGNREINLSWKRLDEANAYRVRVYKIEGSQRTLMTERMIKNSRYEIGDINALGEGDFLWSVQAFEMTPDGSRILRKSPVSQSHFSVKNASSAKKIKILTPHVIYVE